MKYARIIDNIVQDTFVPQPGFTIEESFHADVAALYVAVSDEVDHLWKRHNDGSFSAPTPVTIPVTEI
jgi:hypothetical protein